MILRANEFGSGNQWMAYSNLIFFLGMMLVFYFTVWRLLRVETDQQKVYVSNYFKTYSYSIESVESIEFLSSFPLQRAILHLKSDGSLGRHLPFLVHQAGIDTLLESEHPLSKKITLN